MTPQAAGAAPAYPTSYTDQRGDLQVFDGLTKREYFAAMADVSAYEPIKTFMGANYGESALREGCERIVKSLREIASLRPAAGGEAAIIKEASEVLEAVGVSGVALPDNWRWPLADELSGIAAMLTHPAPAAREAVPEGMVPVPLVPTPEMDAAGKQALTDNGVDNVDTCDALLCYAAMLAAAPPPQANEPDRALTDDELMDELDRAQAKPQEGECSVCHKAWGEHRPGYSASQCKSTPPAAPADEGREVDEARFEQAFNAWCDVAEVDEYRVRNPREALHAALAALKGEGRNG